MSRGKKLAKNTFILFIGSFFTKIIKYFLLPVYTAYLTTKEYGTVELYNTIISLFIPLISLQVEQGLFRYLVNNRNNELEKGKLISSVFIFTMFTIIISLIIYLCISPFLSFEYKWLLIVNLILCDLSSLVLQISRGLGENKAYSFTSFLTALVTISFNILFLVGMKLKVDGILYGSAIGYFAGIIFIFIRLKLYKYISIKKFDKSAIKELLKFSMPMIPNSLSWWVFSSSDRIVITTFIGLSATGILSIAYKFSNISIMLYNVFNLSLTESICIHIDDKDLKDYYNKIYNIVGNLFVFAMTFFLGALPFIYNILINKRYNDAYNLIPIAMIATLFQVLSTMMGTIYVARKNTKSVAITSICAAIINIVSDILLVKFIGIYAAVISTLLSYILLFVYRIIDVRKKYLKIVLSKKFILYTLIAILIVCPIYYINNLYIRLLGVVCTIIISIIFNKNELLHMRNKIVKRTKNKESIKKVNESTYNYINIGEYDFSYYDSYNSDNINNYLDDLDRVKMKIRFDNSVIGQIDFSKCPYEISDVILSETKVYNFEFNNDYLLRHGKYPKQISNNYELMKYILDQDYNYLAYINTDVTDKNVLIDIINYAFTKVYYMKIKDNNIDFDIDNLFKNSSIIKHNYFKECYSYIEKMNKNNNKSKKKVKA